MCGAGKVTKTARQRFLPVTDSLRTSATQRVAVTEGGAPPKRVPSPIVEALGGEWEGLPADTSREEGTDLRVARELASGPEPRRMCAKAHGDPISSRCCPEGAGPNPKVGQDL